MQENPRSTSNAYVEHVLCNQSQHISDQNERTPAHVKTTPVRCSISSQAHKRYIEFLDKLKAEFKKKFDSKFEREEKLADFEILQTIGEGAYGRINLTRYKKYDMFYAMKIYLKEVIVKSNIIKHLLYEKHVLQSLRFPFVINMEYFFKDNDYIFMVLPVLIGGDMFQQLRKFGKFDEKNAQFYAAQLILALQYLHHIDLIHRDLKPENVLIDTTGYVKISDFGFSKIVSDRTGTFCGTPEYLAPEIILAKTYGKAVDWWSFGIMLYEMVAGYTPFYAHDPMKLYEKIVAGRYRFPKHVGNDLRDLLGNVLQIDPTRRYGNLRDGVLDLQNHRWFLGLNWTSILNRKIEAPFTPKVKNPGDTGNFSRFNEVPLKSSPTCQFEKEFEDF